MTLQRLAVLTLRVLVYLVLDLLEALAYFTAIALFTIVIRLVLPFPVAFAVSLLGVSVYFGYRRALRLDRARMRGGIR